MPMEKFIVSRLSPYGKNLYPKVLNLTVELLNL
jgi:hypothetical protein